MTICRNQRPLYTCDQGPWGGGGDMSDLGFLFVTVGGLEPWSEEILNESNLLPYLK